MKTDDLIALLASDPFTSARRARWKDALAVGGGLSAALVGVMTMGMHEPLLAWFLVPSIAIKMLWLGLMTVAMAWAVRHLARPGRSADLTLWVLPLAWLAMLVAAVLISPDADQQGDWWMGRSALVCPFNILALSAPVLAALVWCLRDRAPTRPALTGGVAGVLAGCLAATVYSMHCTETSLGFFALWYGSGIALSGAVGAWAGWRWLRW